MLVNISDLEVGDRAEVVTLDNKAVCFRQKLLALGVVPGAVIEVKRVAPLGDPFAIQINEGLMISLRKVEGCIVKVKRLLDR